MNWFIIVKITLKTNKRNFIYKFKLDADMNQWSETQNIASLQNHMKTKLLLLLTCTSFILSCKPSVNSAGLYGKWDYIKIEHPTHDRPDIAAAELKQQGASIEFLKDNTFVIMWGGNALSKGKFTAAGDKIQINESLPDGTTRSFAFYITKISDTEITFETKGSENSRVTAVKE